MAGRPAQICKLVKGKIIDAQAGFVDTFNWMLDFIDNLKGEGELSTKTGSGNIVLDRTISDRPIIRGGGGGGSGGPVVLIDTEGNQVQVGDGEAADAKTIRFSSMSGSNTKVSITGTGSTEGGHYSGAIVSIGQYYS